MPTTTDDGHAPADRVAEEARWARRSRLPATVLAVVAAVVSVLALVELAAGVSVLVDLGPAWAPTTALTPLMGLSTATALLLARTAGSAARPGPAICFGLTGLLAVVALLERATGTVLLADLLAVEESSTGVDIDERTSLVVVVSFALLALGGGALVRGSARCRPDRRASWP